MYMTSKLCAPDPTCSQKMCYVYDTEIVSPLRGEWYIFLWPMYASKEYRYFDRAFGNEPDVNRTRNLLIWSQTRYHCATDPTCFKALN